MKMDKQSLNGATAMIIEHTENVDSEIQGTIIDIETIGDFYKSCPPNDSRRYKDIKIVIFGFINKHQLNIFCAGGMEAIGFLEKKVHDVIIDNLEKPFYAFNCDFERGVCFHHIGKEIDFGGELNKEKYESKAAAVRDLRIDNYGDPFHDNGYKCMQAWSGGKFDDAIAHNRACLLKERDILVNRKYRVPDKLIFVKP
jgi:hypothetical protein